MNKYRVKVATPKGVVTKDFYSTADTKTPGGIRAVYRAAVAAAKAARGNDWTNCAVYRGDELMADLRPNSNP